MFQFPQYEENGQERLHFPNIWRNIETQQVVGSDCFNPSALLNNDDNLIVLKMSAIEFTQMFSALYEGAVKTYPETWMQIIVNFLKGLHCPPLMTEQECYEYPPYASFIGYTPANPFIDPDFVPEGYLIPPFQIGVLGYQPYDVVVPMDSIPIDADWLTDIADVLPQITIMVNGAGKAFIKLLPQFNGGLACITLDNSPDLADIFVGIVTGADNIMDLNMDVLSIPPETASEVIYELDVVGTGIHTIYITFLPIIDDSFIPLRFGGGFRGVQLCNFVEQPDMGITDIRFDGGSCELQVMVDGEWEQVSGWEDWLDCVPSGGGGGGAAAITVNTFNGSIGANYTNNTTSFTNVLASLYTPSRANMLVICSNVTLGASGGAVEAQIKLTFNSVNDDENTTAQLRGSSGGIGKETSVTGIWTDVEIGVGHYLGLNARCTTAGTATVYNTSDWLYTVIEFDSIDDLFVEDVRIFEGELQKKIGGAWIAVSDSFEAIINSLQSGIATAQATANGAVATNVSQAAQITSIIGVNNTQNTRLDNLEDDVADHETRLDNIDIINVYQSGAIEDLQTAVNVLEFGGAWAWLQDFSAGGAGYSALSGSYSAGVGWVFDDTNDLHINYVLEMITQNQVTHLQIQFFRDTDHATVEISLDGSNWYHCPDGLSGVNTLFWMRVPNDGAFNNFTIHMRITAGFACLNQARYLGRGDECPFD